MIFLLLLQLHRLKGSRLDFLRLTRTDNLEKLDDVKKRYFHGCQINISLKVDEQTHFKI